MSILADRMAELRARKALEAAGLDEAVPLTRMTSVTNEVWRTPHHVVRLSRPGNHRLRREALVARALPPEAGYPDVVHSGQTAGGDLLVLARMPGAPLAHAWPALDPQRRRRAVHQIGERVAAIHRTPEPEQLPPVQAAPGMSCATAGRVDDLVETCAEVGARRGADPGLLREAAERVAGHADALDGDPSATLVHGDLHFENVLWDGDNVRAILDFEFARTGPPDLELDVFLRMCAYPELHVGDAHVSRTDATAYHAAPDWLRDAYPQLFGHPRLLDRLKTYALAYDVCALAEMGDAAWSDRVHEWHPVRRIEATLAGTGYLDHWASRW